MTYPKFYYDLKIREFHIDTLRHVNNATYISIFEEARWDLVTSRGYGLKEVQKFKKSPIVLEIDIKFHKEVVNRENVKIETTMLGYKSKVGKLQQSLLGENGEVSCVAIFTIGFFDLVERKLIEPSPEWRQAIALDEGKES
ncbi:MAG: acyl-CoA thioesterase [Bdellovibrionales bacterium]